MQRITVLPFKHRLIELIGIAFATISAAVVWLAFNDVNLTSLAGCFYAYKSHGNMVFVSVLGFILPLILSVVFIVRSKVNPARIVLAMAPVLAYALMFSNHFGWFSIGYGMLFIALSAVTCVLVMGKNCGETYAIVTLATIISSDITKIHTLLASTWGHVYVLGGNVGLDAVFIFGPIASLTAIVVSEIYGAINKRYKSRGQAKQARTP